MTLALSRRQANLIGFLACVGLMAYALYAQHVLGYEPCPLCVFQRVAVMAVGALFLLAALFDPPRTGARVFGVLIDLAAVAGILVAIRHLWIQAQPPGTVAECGASLDYMLDVLPITEVVTKVLTGAGECGKIDWMFLGLTMPAWVLIALVGLGSWGLFANFVLRRPGE
ncbi:MAG TPA: disulfide bond formation protein B [Steroidobacteraceae bacterium]|nr:disulfide bond formation protein B [Steroidobacteraceae bacterium]